MTAGARFEAVNHHLMKRDSPARLRRLLRAVMESAPGMWLGRPVRIGVALKHLARTWKHIIVWVFQSRERTNFTYDYTTLGNTAAVEFVSLVTGTESAQIAAFANELATDVELKQWLSERVAHSPYRYSADSDVRFGRRLLYYLFVRAIKPRIVVEAGTDKGLGACLVAAALQRNKAEGAVGQIYAVDNREDRGFLLGERFADVAVLQIGDTVTFLDALEEKIDFFIHDTTTEQQHEQRQYRALEGKLAPGAITTSAWFTNEFVRFTRRNSYRFLLFQEAPREHWYPGGLLPVSFAPGHLLERTTGDSR